MGCSHRVLRILVGAAVFLGVIWFLYVGILVNHAPTTKKTVTVPSTRNSEHWKLIGRRIHQPGHHGLDLNYVSKRRVPNGPDPIHNRRAAKSREPPGRA